MKVFLVGATGNLGSRLVLALLNHRHQVVAYVRSTKKLESLLPTSVIQKITIIEGDAKSSESIQRALLDSQCDAVINTAGAAAITSLKRSDMPEIFEAVVKAVQQVGDMKGTPLRAWFLGVMGLLYWPGTETMLSNGLPIFLEHHQDYTLLRSLPKDAIDWSMFCPAEMMPYAPTVEGKVASLGKLIASANTPALWQNSWLKQVPFLGQAILGWKNASRYKIYLEQAAEFIAEDLETAPHSSQWSGKTVGIIDATRA